MIDINYCFRKSNQISCKQVGDEFFIMDSYRQKLIQLNPVAFEIWRLLDGRHSISGIMEIIEEKFEAEKKVVYKDTVNFIKELINRELIE